MAFIEDTGRSVELKLVRVKVFGESSQQALEDAINLFLEGLSVSSLNRSDAQFPVLDHLCLDRGDTAMTLDVSLGQPQHSAQAGCLVGRGRMATRKLLR
jgi:hypothetical protein